jgi:hypothetical protein
MFSKLEHVQFDTTAELVACQDNSEHVQNRPRNTVSMLRWEIVNA